MPKKAENSQANTERTCTPRRGRSKIVKSMPILKNNKIYRVGEEFPYTEKDKSLLWNLVDKPKANSSDKNNDQNKTKE